MVPVARPAGSSPGPALLLENSSMDKYRPKPSRKTVGRSLAVAVLLVAMTSGCSNDDEPKSSNDSGNTTTTKAPEGSGKVETVDPKKVIASQTVSVPTSPEDTVDIGLESLKVDG